MREANLITDSRLRALEYVRNSQFPFAQSDVLCLFIGGSELHGAKLHAMDDLDIYGAFVEPPHIALGLTSHEHFVASTASAGRRNGPDDVDITLYGLRKWAHLACKGNPTALHYLFADYLAASAIWKSILSRKQMFLSRSAAKHFYGFADSQLKRMTGHLGQGKHGQRPELEEKYGYDVKAGMHAIRLLHECIELMRNGKITLPRPEKALLIQIRTGAWSLESVTQLSQHLLQECREAEENSPLPSDIDTIAVSQLIAEKYTEHWRSQTEAKVE